MNNVATKKAFELNICDNCGKGFVDDEEVNLMERFSGLYYKTCSECIPTCHYCGQDSGYAKNEYVSSMSCDVCDKDSCRSCGITVTCYGCGKTACETCIEEESGREEVCKCMIYILELLKKWSRVSE